MNMAGRNGQLQLLVAGLIGISGVIAIVAVTALSFVGRDVPPALTGLAGAALGSLVTWFVQYGKVEAQVRATEAKLDSVHELVNSQRNALVQEIADLKAAAIRMEKAHAEAMKKGG